jgi:SPFH domain / Band 7 family
MCNGLLVAAALSLAACGRIETGFVGVRTEFNKTVGPTVMAPGFYTAFFSSVDEYVVKEIEVKFDNLTPKGKDNLSLEDFDVSIFYQPFATDVAKMVIKYTGMSPVENGVHYPMFNLVERVGRSGVLDVVSRYDSLTMHTKRSELESAIKEQVQADLDAADKGQFIITKVIVRQVKTDKTLEGSIQRAVQMQKEIEAKELENKLAQAEAKRKITEAEGIATSNTKISASVTDNLIRYKQAEAMKEAAKLGTVVLMPMDSKTMVTLPALSK